MPIEDVTDAHNALKRANNFVDKTPTALGSMPEIAEENSEVRVNIEYETLGIC